MHIFYTPNIPEGYLSKEESRHCNKVLRLQNGDQIAIINGTGDYAVAEIIDSSDKKTSYTVIEIINSYKALPYNLHIAIAPTKNINRFEWFLEKVTEIGISQVTPIICENSERKVIKPERLEKLIVSAAKQSKKASFPILNEAVTFEAFLTTNNSFKGEKLIAYCEQEVGENMKKIKGIKDVIMCIGPEGDFTEKEVQQAFNMGYKSVSFGESRLRTETAGVFACSAINLLNQD